MIPSIEQICEDLAAGRITIQQAIEWLYLHMQNAELRDGFAMAALPCVLTIPFQEGAVAAGVSHADALKKAAAGAYLVADAMLVERAKA